MDKDWVHLPRPLPAYGVGARAFIASAMEKLGNPSKLQCPCSRCINLFYHTSDDVVSHLIIYGMDKTYTTWFFHGEEHSTTSPKVTRDCDEIADTYRMFVDAHVNDEEIRDYTKEMRDEGFSKLLEEAETPLYRGCTNYTKLTATVLLFKHKAVNGISDKAFTELLKILSHMFPPENTLPSSTYAAKKLFKTFDLGYEKIHACVNDCCLYRLDLAELDNCPRCGKSRWKIVGKGDERKIKKGVPAKVLRYFPIIPRFKRMFRSSENSKQLLWHSTHHGKDNKMHHPVDSPQWNFIDNNWSDFASDPRNLRLALATDGFNPFSNLSSTYSCWPVMLVTYNLPPWLCMKSENLMLTLLIPGPKQPGNDIDVYLRPLIEDLKELWVNGVEVYDAYKNNMFNLRAILMWTINDFPAYGNLAGCTTKGKAACPICGVETCSIWLPYSNKCAYMSHRRFLASNHPYRKKRSWFDGTIETRGKPSILTGSQVLEVVSDIKNEFGKGEDMRIGDERRKCMEKGKGHKKRKRKTKRRNVVKGIMWKKKPIFFELPYYQYLPVRHCLDLMHVEKNCAESLISTLLDIKGKSKDGLNARKDMEKMGIRSDLHPRVEENNKIFLPPAQHTLTSSEKETFYWRLRNLKVPDGYSSNIAKCFTQDDKLFGLKSHDYHVLMQQLLPIALRGILPKGPRNAIFRLCSFFNNICQRVIDTEKLAVAEGEIVETLCMLERYFPPSFFDIMIHLPIHLGRETRYCGPNQFHWMFPFERFMKTCKGNVRNPARPEGCICECYLAEESMRYCSRYIKKACEIGQTRDRNEDDQDNRIFDGRPISKGEYSILSAEDLENAHRYVLFNTAEVEPYEEMRMEELKRLHENISDEELSKKHSETFCHWFTNKVKLEMRTGNVSEMIKWLSYWPRKQALSYSGFIINGYRFRTKDTEKSTQNSGVSLEATTVGKSSSNNNVQSSSSTIGHYGILRDIIVLDYLLFQIPIFKCDWANIYRGVKVEDGFTLVNFDQFQNQFKGDPFILATQASQVFYWRESKASNWQVVVRPPPRGYHDLEMYEENKDEEQELSYNPLDTTLLDRAMEDLDGGCVRVGGDDILVDL